MKADAAIVSHQGEEELPAWSLPRDAVDRIAIPLQWPDRINREWALGGSTGKGATVCIIDSGIEPNHPLVGEVDRAVAVTVSETGELVVEEDEEGDLCGHGTACAGIVRALAPECSLVSVRVLGAGFTGSGPALLGGLRWAVEQGFDVVNMSLSTTKQRFAETLHEIADQAYFGKTMLVASAHNLPVESYPWRFASVISVGSHESADSLEFFYNPTPPVEFFARGRQSRRRLARRRPDTSQREQLRDPAHLGDLRAHPQQASGADTLPAEERALPGRNERRRCAVSEPDRLRSAAAVGVLASEEAHLALLGSIVDVARAIFGARASSIFLLDEETDELVFEAASGLGSAELVGSRFPSGTGIAGWVLATRQPLVLEDVSNDPRFARDLAEATGYVPKALMAVPLLHEERALGVLEVLDRPDRGRSPLVEMDLLGLFAGQAAIALDLLQAARRARAVLAGSDKELTVVARLAEALDGLEGEARIAGLRLLEALDEVLRKK